MLHLHSTHVVMCHIHYRYRLWIKVWQAWTARVDAACVKHALREQGEKIFCARLQGRAWTGWRRYVQAQRRERERMSLAKQWHLDNSRRYVYSVLSVGYF